MRVDTVRAAICNRYSSVAACARAIGWPRQRLHRIVIGIKTPDIIEVKQIANALEQPIDEVASLFLSESHRMDDYSKAASPN